MERHDFIVVADKFSEFARFNSGMTPAQIKAMLTLPDGILPNTIALHRGQGLADAEVEELSRMIRERDPGATKWDIEGLLARSARASGELSHKRKQCNTLVANPAAVDASTYSMDLCIDQNCELMDDHQTGQHVQGMVLIEASRQAFLVVTEAFFLRERNQKSYFVINTVSSKFLNFVFPVHAHLLYRVISKDINDRRQKFEVEIDIVQAEKVCMTTSFVFTVYPADLIAKKERDLAEMAARTSLQSVVPLGGVGPVNSDALHHSSLSGMQSA